MAQTAKALGAKTVIGIARNPEKLKRALEYGCDHVISTVDKVNKDVVGEWRGYCKSKGSRKRRLEDFRGDGHKGRAGSRPRSALLRRQTDPRRLRHGKERVHDVQADGLRCRDHRNMGLPARVLSDRSRYGSQQEDRHRPVRRSKADEHDRCDLRRDPQGGIPCEEGCPNSRIFEQ